MVFNLKVVQFPHRKKDNITNLRRIFNRRFQNFLVQEGKSGTETKEVIFFSYNELTRITNFPFANVPYHTCLF